MFLLHPCLYNRIINVIFGLVFLFLEDIHVQTLFKHEVCLLLYHTKRDGKEQLPNESSVYTHLSKLVTQTQASETL